MGTTTSMGLLEFDSSGIILLAWHLIALVLPMLASILAVLTNSIDLMRKCTMYYWILLSLLFLFEYASVNFMEWNIIEWLHKQRKGEGRLCKRETFLNVVNGYILEYGSRFMRTLTVSQPEKQKHNFQSGTKIIEREGENTAVTSKQVNGEEMTENGCTEIATPPLMQTQQELSCGPCKVTFPSRSRLHVHYQGRAHKSKIKSLENSAKDTGPSTSSTHAPVPNVEEMTPPKENRCAETPPLIQQEHKCGPCEYSTPCQSRWNAHILGRVHKTNLESSKARDTITSPSVQHKRSVSAPSSLEGKYKALEVEDLMPAEESTEERCLKTRSKIDFNAHFHGEKHQFMKLAIDKSEIGAKYNKGTSPSATRELNYGSEAEKTLPLKKEWRCDICKVTTRCEKNLNAHFDGKKHQSKLLKQNKNGAKDRGPSPSATSELNHGNEAEKFTKESGSESEKLTESKAQEQYGKLGDAVWVPKGRDVNAEVVKERSGNLHEKKKILSDDL